MPKRLTYRQLVMELDALAMKFPWDGPERDLIIMAANTIKHLLKVTGK